MLYPLRFKPLFRRYLWGGRRLASVLHKPLGEGDDYAESWEIVDHGDDQSVVGAGPLAGATLHQVVTEHGEELGLDANKSRRFPLLFKFLDAQRDLSVQVHPNDRQAARLSPPDLGKTEAWVILDALPGSKVYAGLRPGFGREGVAQEVAQGTTERCLHCLEPRPGDCLFIPAGTVHALGAGLLVAEIQQSSDTTFRLFDWNRIDADGKPRMLHIEQALQTIDYARGPVNPQIPSATDRPYVECLVACEEFVLNRWNLDSPQPLGGASGRFHLLSVLQGEVRVDGDPTGQPLGKGQTILVPAVVAPETTVQPLGPASFLDIFLP